MDTIGTEVGKIDASTTATDRSAPQAPIDPAARTLVGLLAVAVVLAAAWAAWAGTGGDTTQASTEASVTEPYRAEDGLEPFQPTPELEERLAALMEGVAP